MAGEIMNNPSYSINNMDKTSYLGTAYILNNKADFEPRKNIRLYF